MNLSKTAFDLTRKRGNRSQFGSISSVNSHSQIVYEKLIGGKIPRPSISASPMGRPATGRFWNSTPSAKCSTISMPPSICPHLAMAAYPDKTDQPKREQWRHEQQHRLKHAPGAVDALIADAERLSRKTSLSKTVKDNLQAALTYFINQRARMDYARPCRRALANRLWRGRGRLQDLGQAAPLWCGHALETSGCQDRPEPTRPRPVHRTLGAILAKDRPVRCPGLLGDIIKRQHPAGIWAEICDVCRPGARCLQVATFSRKTSAGGLPTAKWRLMSRLLVLPLLWTLFCGGSGRRRGVRQGAL